MDLYRILRTLEERLGLVNWFPSKRTIPPQQLEIFPYNIASVPGEMFPNFRSYLYALFHIEVSLEAAINKFMHETGIIRTRINYYRKLCKEYEAYIMERRDIANSALKDPYNEELRERARVAIEEICEARDKWPSVRHHLEQNQHELHTREFQGLNLLANLRSVLDSPWVQGYSVCYV